MIDVIIAKLWWEYINNVDDMILFLMLHKKTTILSKIHILSGIIDERTKWIDSSWNATIICFSYEFFMNINNEGLCWCGKSTLNDIINLS